MLESFENLKTLVANAEEDVRKAAGGNKAAGVRARKLMQDIKNAAQTVRVKLLESREDESSEGTPPAGGQA